ncbi:AEC family transporter [Marispirochaeta aestuarii]|uniref:AEC family transporter n=1 Tax=Marispirochaeta aestuarii TaxID=1963862 RepID=UPI0029C96B3D|nr:AEC family transporter [Marispirochaeta aestuarii]
MSGSIAPLILEKLAVLFLLIGTGGLVRKAGLISEEGESVVSTLLVDLFWPALIFTSITMNLSRDDILRNISLPLFAAVTILAGGGLGLIAVKLMKYRGVRRNSFLFQSMMNNFVFLVLPFAVLFLPERGAGLLFVHNLGTILLLWTLCVPVLQGESRDREKELFKSLLKNPGIISTLAAIILVLTGLNTRLPAAISITMDYLGAPTMAIAMLVAGSRIAGTGLKAVRLDAWNLLIALIRLVLVPLILLGLSLIVWNAGLAGPETLLIFMLVNIVPVGVFSVSLANKYRASPELMAQSVALTHVIGAGTMLVWLLVLQKMPFFP